MVEEKGTDVGTKSRHSHRGQCWSHQSEGLETLQGLNLPRCFGRFTRGVGTQRDQIS